MENKKLIIGFVWMFIIAIPILEFLRGSAITFGGYMILFFIALGSTVAVETMLPEKHHGSEIQSELQELISKLDEFTKKSN